MTTSSPNSRNCEIHRLMLLLSRPRDLAAFLVYGALRPTVPRHSFDVKSRFFCALVPGRVSHLAIFRRAPIER
jgi:hypothetical protein